METVQRSRLAYTDDRFSMLPDEILGLILSSLSLKEAMATSILCSRLRYSWIFTSNLDLHIDYYAALFKQPRKYDACISREHTLQCMYVKWVDSLLFQQLRKFSTNLFKFRLSFHLSSSFALWIDDWLNYAVSRKVESVDLNLIVESVDLNLKEKPEKRYSFPYKQGNFPDNLKLLKKLCLHSVNVSGEAVAFMAPCLHRFVIEASYQEIHKKYCYTCDNFDDGSDVLDRDKIIRLRDRDTNIGKAYSHVKEVEFVGYRGVFNHFQLIAKFVKYGVALEKITVDPRSFELSRHMPWDHIFRNHTEDEIVARNRARDQLKYSRINDNIL